jgi:hypothetical protein
VPADKIRRDGDFLWSLAHHGLSRQLRARSVLRTVIASNVLSSRRWAASSTDSCSHRVVRRSGLEVHLDFIAHCEQALLQ